MTLDNITIWLCHKPPGDPDHYDDPSGSASNLTHRNCPDCVCRTHRQVRLMQRWTTSTKTTLPPPQPSPNAKGKRKATLVSVPRDTSRPDATLTPRQLRARTTSSRGSAGMDGPDRRVTAAARGNVAAPGCTPPPTAATAPPAPPRQSVASPRPYRAPSRRDYDRKASAPVHPHDGLKRKQPHMRTTEPDPKQRRRQHFRSPNDHRDHCTDQDRTTDTTSATRSETPRATPPRRLTTSATPSQPPNPPAPDHAAPPAGHDHRSTGNHQHVPGHQTAKLSQRQKKAQEKN